MEWNRKQGNLSVMLFALTILFLCAQVAFFFVHYKVGNIIDSLAHASIRQALFDSIILLPIIEFVLLQLIAYGLFIGLIYLMTCSLVELLRLTEHKKYALGIVLWFIGCCAILSLNAYYYPRSFFAQTIFLNSDLNVVLMISSLLMLLLAAIFTCINCFWFKRHTMMGIIFTLIFCGLFANYNFFSMQNSSSATTQKPNIIFIGLDSLRPDYIGYLGHPSIHTPTINKFLESAVVFTNAYTPLARTYPSWMSILTGKYPLHHHARMNLAEPSRIISNDNLAKKLQAQGYLTIYGTDEVRFTDISTAYGFDRIIGPKGGAVEFLLGSLSDFPLTNLMLNLPVGKFLFPYNYANRAADITYHPLSFLHLVKKELNNRPNKPVFLALHLCLSHWPFRWAQDKQQENVALPAHYISSVEAIDAQLGYLLQILAEAGLLKHSMIVLLSDHGVTLGMRGDRVIGEKSYIGNIKGMRRVSAVKLATAPDFTLDIKHNYSISASYGQGTDVISLKQNRILLAYQVNNGEWRLTPKTMQQMTSVLNIAPTILDYLQLEKMHDIDGYSEKNLLVANRYINNKTPFFIESGDKVSSIESNKIFIENVIKQTIGAYRIDKSNGTLILAPEAEKSIISNKQYAILWNDWMLALYPAEMHYIIESKQWAIQKKFLLSPTRSPPYYILTNLKSGLWTTELTSTLAKNAPIDKLIQKLKSFYGDEIKIPITQ